jgi:hypothetical protein
MLLCANIWIILFPALARRVSHMHNASDPVRAPVVTIALSHPFYPCGNGWRRYHVVTRVYEWGRKSSSASVT